MSEQGFLIKGTFWGKEISSDLYDPIHNTPIFIEITKTFSEIISFIDDNQLNRISKKPDNDAEAIKSFLDAVSKYIQRQYENFLMEKTFNQKLCKLYQALRDFLLGNIFEKKYTIGSVIGRGTNGIVSIVIDKSSSEEYVCKKSLISRDINKFYLDQFYLDQFSEVQTMRCMTGSKYNVRFHEYIIFQDETYLIFEKGECDLLQVVLGNTAYSIDPRQKHILFAQLACGIQELHSLGFYHRDLKLANILVSDGNIKITDYGYTDNYPLQDSTKAVGTLNSVPLPHALWTISTLYPEISKNGRLYYLTTAIKLVFLKV